jgi:hypothetical protein
MKQFSFSSPFVDSLVRYFEDRPLRYRAVILER